MSQHHNRGSSGLDQQRPDGSMAPPATHEEPPGSTADEEPAGATGLPAIEDNCVIPEPDEQWFRLTPAALSDCALCLPWPRPFARHLNLFFLFQNTQCGLWDKFCVVRRFRLHGRPPSCIQDMGNITPRENMSWIFAGANRDSGNYDPCEVWGRSEYTREQKIRARGILVTIRRKRWPRGVWTLGCDFGKRQ